MQVSIHKAVKVEARNKHFSDFVCQDLVITTDEGKKITVQIFSDKVLPTEQLEPQFND